MKVVFQLVPLLAFALHTHAHGVITAVTGANGVSGQGFGVIASTPRDGSRRNPFQQDSSIIRDREIERGDADVCGRTLAGGNNDVATQLNAAAAAGLPTAADDGSVTMTLHQVNGDGAGPYTCEVSADATGANFAAMTVTTNVPGRNSRSGARATPFSLVAQMPAGATCTGGPNGDACIVRCRNSARAGPFGGCVAVTNAASGNATGAAAANNVGAVDPAATVAAAASGTIASADVAATDAVNSVAAAVPTSAVAADNTAVGNTAVGNTNSAVNPATGNTNPAVNSAVGNTNSAANPAVDNTGTAVNPAVGNTNAAVNGASSTTGSTSNVNSNAVNANAGFARATVPEDEEEEDDGDVSIEDAELALAADLDRRFAERVTRSRIVGRRAI